MKKKFVVALSVVLIDGLNVSALAHSTDKVPPCYGNENYATQSALTEMVNAGLIPSSASIYRDEKHAYSLKTALLDSEKIGKYSGPGFPTTDVYRLTQKISVRTKENKAFDVITISEASFAECSLSEPVIIVIYPDLQTLSAGKSILTKQ